jgi:hypothetical protein
VILLYTQTSIPAECKSVLEQLYMIILYFGELRKHIRTLNIEENFTCQKLTTKLGGNDENDSQLNMDSKINVTQSQNWLVNDKEGKSIQIDLPWTQVVLN